MSKLATPQQIQKLKNLGISFEENISLEEARELLIEANGLREVQPKKFLTQRPELFNSLLVRSEQDGVRYMDGVRYLS